jgi:hypothetical protein
LKKSQSLTLEFLGFSLIRAQLPFSFRPLILNIRFLSGYLWRKLLSLSVSPGRRVMIMAKPSSFALSMTSWSLTEPSG